MESHKHLGLILDSKLSFGDHLKEKISKTNKIIGTLKRLRKFLPRRCLVHIYKAFARPLLDYGDLIYDNPGNASFSSKLESIQYNAMLAISGAIRGTSREKLYQEIGIESLEDRRWLRRLCLFYKIINNNTPSYLHDLVKKQIPNYSFRSFSVRSYTSRTKRFQNSFFPYCSKQWDELDDKTQNSPSVFSLKKSLLQFIRPSPCSIFGVHNPSGVTLLTRLRVGLSHLRGHKFHHNFFDTENPSCPFCNNKLECTKHYLLHCPNFFFQRIKLFGSLSNISVSILPLSPSILIQILLYGDRNFCDDYNFKILSSTITYLIDTKRFDGPLF